MTADPRPAGMTIGVAAAASGVHAKMIRYYERIGLLPPAARSAGGYRLYTEAAVNTLRFISRARRFGFPIERIRRLVGLWRSGEPSREVKRVALEHVAELERRIAELSAMRDALSGLAQACEGDQRPECPILRDLAGEPAGPRLEPASAARRSAGRAARSG